MCRRVPAAYTGASSGALFAYHEKRTWGSSYFRSDSRPRRIAGRRCPGGDRRVNVDPGYVSALQMVLATTKPLPQAIYLRDGVYAVVELIYRDGAFAALPWTYPDYRKAAAENLFEPFRSQFLKLQRKVGE